MKPKFNVRYRGQLCRVCLVREGSGEQIKISEPEDVYQLVKDELANSDREKLLSIMLNTDNGLIGVEEVSIGTLDSAIAVPREIFKSAILANAMSIILCHNHPSGSLKPSSYDYDITKAAVDAGKVIGIKVHDHVLVSHEGFKSLREEGSAKINWR